MDRGFLCFGLLEFWLEVRLLGSFFELAWLGLLVGVVRVGGRSVCVVSVG